MATLNSYIVTPSSKGVTSRQINGVCSFYKTRSKHIVGFDYVDGKEIKLFHPFKTHDQFTDVFLSNVKSNATGKSVTHAVLTINGINAKIKKQVRFQVR